MALAATVFAVTVGAVVFILKPQMITHVPPATNFSPEIFEDEGFNTGAQLAAYTVAMMLCIGAALAMALLDGRRRMCRMRRVWTLVLFLAAVLGIGLLLSNLRSVLHYTRVNALWLTAAMGIAITGFALGRLLSTRSAWVLKFLAVSLAVVFMLPGFLHKLNLTTERLSFVEAHYSLMPGCAGRLAAGLKPFTDVEMRYGAVLPFLFGEVERVAGPLTLGQYMTVVQSLQVVFLGLAVIAYCLWRPRDLLYLTACLFLILPWLETCGQAVVWPNVSAWRLMNLASGVLVLIATRRVSSEQRAAWLGATAAFAVFYNSETGLALSAAYLFGLIISSRPRAYGEIMRTLSVAVLAGAGMVVLLALGAIGLGLWPLPLQTLAARQFTGVGSGAFGGRPFLLSPLTLIALGMFMHAGVVLVCSLIVWRRGKLTADGAIRASISVFLMGFACFFVNRPVNGWYLFGVLFLYTFLLPDYIAAARRIVAHLATYRKSWRGVAATPGALKHLSWREIALAAFTFLLLMPFGAHEAYQALRQVTGRSFGRTLGHFGIIASELPPDGTLGSPPPPAAQLWSGVWVKPGVASMLEEKVSFLREQAPDVVYFAADSFTIAQASQIYPPLPIQDLFHETMFREDYRRLLRALGKLQPKRILFEPDASPLFFSPLQRRLFDRLKKDVTQGYEYAGTMHGWEVFDRPSPES
jgi:hypothetical protein